MSNITTIANAEAKKITSTVDLDNNKVLYIQTYKSVADGNLITSASVGVKSVNGLIVLGSNYHREFVRAKVRCTMGNLTKQHNTYLDKIQDIIADVHHYYSTKNLSHLVMG